MESRHRTWVLASLAAASLAVAAAASLAFVSSRRTKSGSPSGSTTEGTKKTRDDVVSVAFVGNSIIYYNDTPRFLAYLRNKASALSGGGPTMVQDSCLKGGSSLVSILRNGNGMRKKFGTPNAERPDGTYDIGAPSVSALLTGEDGTGGAEAAAEGRVDGIGSTTRKAEKKWDYVVLNDYTQAPARPDLRQSSVDALTAEYVPMLRSCSGVPVFLVTAAYREPVKDSSDLGTVEEYTAKLLEGYEEYAAAVGTMLPESQRPVVAPVGPAYLRVWREDRALWRKLFHTDDFHPSPHGSYLQACMLYRSMFGELPPTEVAVPDDAEGGPGVLWDRAEVRVMQPAGTPPLDRPTVKEAEYLLDVAGRTWDEYGK